MQSTLSSAPQPNRSEETNGSGHPGTGAAGIVSLCGQTLTLVSDDVSRSIAALERVADDFAQFRAGEGAPTTQQLATPLDALSVEIGRQKRTLAAITDTLQKLTVSPDPPGPQSVAGALSRLPGRTEAEVALEALRRTGCSSLAGLFYVERLGLVNERFGSAAGDAVVAELVSRIAQLLSNGESLYRWAGAGFMGLFQRESVKGLRTEVDHHVPARFEKTIELAHRTALIKVSCKWDLFVFSSGEPIVDMISGIDAVFAGWQAGRASRSVPNLNRA